MFPDAVAKNIAMVFTGEEEQDVIIHIPKELFMVKSEQIFSIVYEDLGKGDVRVAVMLHNGVSDDTFERYRLKILDD